MSISQIFFNYLKYLDIDKIGLINLIIYTKKAESNELSTFVKNKNY